MSVPARLSLVTLGVADVAAAAAFYEALGWRRSDASTPDVAFFATRGPILALYDAALLAADVPAPDGSPAPQATLALNVGDPAEVRRVVAEMTSAGGRPLGEPASTPWGGFVGYVRDPGGWVWEIAHNPGFPLDDSGTATLPDGPV